MLFFYKKPVHNSTPKSKNLLELKLYIIHRNKQIAKKWFDTYKQVNLKNFWYKGLLVYWIEQISK